MAPDVFVGSLAHALGDRKLHVTESAAAGRLVSDAADLESAGFRWHHVCAPGTSAYHLAVAAVTQLAEAGQLPAIDAIVYATGFDAMTGPIVSVDIRGRDGATLKDVWAHGPTTYLGLTTVGFPNFFMITGPGSPSVLSNMMVSIEQHVDWIADCLAAVRKRGATVIEAEKSAEEAWVGHVGESAGATLRSTCSSWYVGANIPGKPRVFMPYIGGVGPYRLICNEVAAKGYQGFAMTGDERLRAAAAS